MKKLILKLLFLFFFIPNINYAQIWPFSPMVRFGNTVYYKLESKEKIELTGTNTRTGKVIENRYFDIILKNTDINIKINDSIFNFSQKTRTEPKDEKEILFYSRRKLKNNYLKINYLKIIEINENYITAEASVKYKSGKNKRRKEIIEIDRNQINGVFIGAGEKYSKTLFGIGVLVGVTFVVIVN